MLVEFSVHPFSGSSLLSGNKCETSATLIVKNSELKILRVTYRTFFSQHIVSDKHREKV